MALKIFHPFLSILKSWPWFSTLSILRTTQVGGISPITLYDQTKAITSLKMAPPTTTTQKPKGMSRCAADEQQLTRISWLQEAFRKSLSCCQSNPQRCSITQSQKGSTQHNIPSTKDSTTFTNTKISKKISPTPSKTRCTQNHHSPTQHRECHEED